MVILGQTNELTGDTGTESINGLVILGWRGSMEWLKLDREDE